MHFLHCGQHADMGYAVGIRVDHRHDRQLVYEWRQAGCRGFKLAKRMLDVSMKRDTSLCVDPGVNCLGRCEFGYNKSCTRHGT
jgi:hypothetical protein